MVPAGPARRHYCCGMAQDFLLQIHFPPSLRAALGRAAARPDRTQRALALPLLTTYAPAFDPDMPLPASGDPTVMTFAGFTADGVPQYHWQSRPQWTALPGPVRARFLSAHLIFTLGRFVADVPYDPELYFIGEEISLAIRAFSHGYALLHPSVHVMWHEYSRRRRVMHWDDHHPAAGVEMAATARDAASLAKVRRLLAGLQEGRFGCGNARSLAEYEGYAGLDFARRRASLAARRGTEPPAPPPPGSGVGAPRDWRVRIALDRATLPPAALDRPAFWYVGFHDAAGVEVARADAEFLRTAFAAGQRR